MAKSSKKLQGNAYDKIFRENIEAALPGIIKNILGLEIVESIELPDDIQHTKERNPDLLKKVIDKTGKIFILHIEYQTRNDKEMAYRMADYNTMLLRKYKLAVKPYVLYFGKAKVSMPNRIDTENLQFYYTIIDLSSIDYKIFLQSNKPEEKILAILANFEKDKPVVAIKNILKGVKASTKGSLAENKYFNQLRVLVQLRDLKPQFNKAMESITAFFKEENDPLFEKGKREGKEEGREEFITYLLKELKLSNQQAADIVKVPVKVVQKVRKKLQK